MNTLNYLTPDSTLDRIEDFTFRGHKMPLALAGGFQRYLEHHVRTGSFLESILANDLVGAIRQAESLDLVELCVNFLLWNAPVQSWGSQDRVKAWVETNRDLPFNWDTTEVTQ